VGKSGVLRQPYDRGRSKHSESGLESEDDRNVSDTRWRVIWRSVKNARYVIADRSTLVRRDLGPEASEPTMGP
jgi:hypothetical protein